MPYLPDLGYMRELGKALPLVAWVALTDNYEVRFEVRYDT
jgi:hypothetical protein